MKANNFSAKVFVTTYAKYNNDRGTVGKWLNVEEYESKDAFLDACKKIHDDESEPEFMFADYEGVPNGYISESYVSEWLFTLNDLDEYFDFAAFARDLFIDDFNFCEGYVFCQYY